MINTRTRIMKNNKTWQSAIEREREPASGTGWCLPGMVQTNALNTKQFIIKSLNIPFVRWLGRALERDTGAMVYDWFYDDT